MDNLSLDIASEQEKIHSLKERIAWTKKEIVYQQNGIARCKKELKEIQVELDESRTAIDLLLTDRKLKTTQPLFGQLVYEEATISYETDMGPNYDDENGFYETDNLLALYCKLFDEKGKYKGKYFVAYLNDGGTYDTFHNEDTYRRYGKKYWETY